MVILARRCCALVAVAQHLVITDIKHLVVTDIPVVANIDIPVASPIGIVGTDLERPGGRVSCTHWKRVSTRQSQAWT